MRVIAPATAGTARTGPRVRRTLNVELLGLIAATLVVLSGIALVRAGKAGRLDEIARPDAIVPLYALEGPRDLEPVLATIVAPSDRQATALAIYRRATTPGAPLEHVGGLAPVLSQADLFAIKPRLAVRTLGAYNARVWRAAAWFVVAFWLAHLFRRWRRRDDDPVLLPAVMLLCGIGMIAMLALRDPLRDTIAAVPFAGGVAAGILVLVAASEFDFEASPLRRSVLAPLGAALALAAALLLFGTGPGASGVKVNLLGVQPVEAIRLLVVLALAAYFGRRIELLRALSEPPTPDRPWLRHVRLPRWRDVRPVFVSMALVLAFFFLQKDLGPALVLSCVFLAMYGIGRGHVAFVATGLALLLAGFTLAYWVGTPATVRNRVMIWSNPWNNGVPGGNHIAHGLWALSTGAAWGSGPGLGSPHAIPAGHTDFVLAAVGEELGFVGLAAIIALYVLVCWRCLRAAARAPGDYSAFLAVGAALALVVQALVIGAGLLGAAPLAGVVTPFLSFGRSSMLANCFAIGIVLSVARRRSPPREHLRLPIRALGAVLAAAALALAGRAAWIQIYKADAFASAASLSEQADGGYRYEHNPRLLAAARTLVRGTIYDRNGLPLATSRPDEIASVDAMYRAAGLVAPEPCLAADDRCYPLGGLAFHLLGDWNTQANWGARNSSYIERDSDGPLKGFDDRARLVEVVNPRTGRRDQAIHRDFRELLPLVRDRYRPETEAVRALRTRNRDLTTTVDARLQIRAATALRDRVVAGGQARGAAVVLDAETGEVLAAASYPWPLAGDWLPDAAIAPAERASRQLDRARYGLYPPGSTFKLLVAGAAIRARQDGRTYQCIRLPGGRVGNFVRGSSRPVRDDPMDTHPHGRVELDRGLVVSCNAYFAQLAQDVGPRPLLEAASLFQIDVAREPAPANLAATLAHAGYGQGQVVVSPLKLARVSASIASGGAVVGARWLTGGDAASAEAPFLPAGDAARLARAMRGVVTSGTARSLRSHPVPIAGKTGTAELDGQAAHSWFTGFAPYDRPGRRIAFAVVVENAGYGARSAGPIAAQIVTAASEFGVIK